MGQDPRPFGRSPTDAANASPSPLERVALVIRSAPTPARSPAGRSRTAAEAQPPAAPASSKPSSPSKPSGPTKPTKPTKPALNAFADGWEDALRQGQSKPGAFAVDDAAVAALATRWAAFFPQRKELPTCGDRGTVGSFNDAQLAVLHRLFWSAPPGAERADIAALAKKEPAFKSRKEPITDDQLQLVTRYRPASFPFSWSDRKRSLCSFVVVEALTSTPADVAAMTVLGQLRKTFDGFLSEPVIGRFARSDWAASPALYPFVAGRLQNNGDKSSTPGPLGPRYALACTGEVKGLPRFGGKLKLTAELAAKVTELAADPRLRYDDEFDDLLRLVGEGLGEPISGSTWKHLREAFPAVPDWNAVHGAARGRFAELVRDLHESRGIGPADIARVLHEEHGYPLYEPARFALLRRDFPDVIPAFRQTRLDGLFADAGQLQAALKKDPQAGFDVVGAQLGFSPARVQALVRIVRLQDPASIPLRRSTPKPWTDAERKQLQAAADAVPVGAGFAEVWKALEDLHPGFFVARPLGDKAALGAAIRRELGVGDWRVLQRERFEALLATTVKGADAGVTLREVVDHLRDEHDCRFGYSFTKQLIRDVEQHPTEHPALAKLKSAGGRFPWEIGGALTRDLAASVAAVMHKHPDKTLAEHVALLKKDQALAAAWPTFGKGHIHKLREEFPDVVPYLDDLRTPAAQKETKAWAGPLDALAKKAIKAASSMPEPSLAKLSQALGVDVTSVRKAVLRHPEDFPWYRRRPTGNIDLTLAHVVARAMEQAPLGTTLQDIVDGLQKDEAFHDRYPAFSRATISTLRELYADVVPGWHERDLMLRTTLIADALFTAPRGTAYEAVVARLEKKHPGAFNGSYATAAAVRFVWEKEPDRFPMLDKLRDTDGKLQLTGMGQKAPSSSSPAAAAAAASTIATQAARLLRMPTNLPLIDFLVDKCRDAPLDSGQRYEFVCVQHLLDSQVPVYDALKKMGMSPSRTTIIGVPYSASDLVVQTLEDKGWDVRVPPLDMDVWQEEVRAVLHARLESALQKNRDIAVMDDGGIVSKLVSTDPLLRAHATRFKIVEQTRRGITVADHVDLAAPVVNVAQSQGKFAEGPLIASDVEQKTVERLARIGIGSLQGKKVGVVGAGTIGMPIALHLKALGAIVTILDPSEAAQKIGKQKGLAVADVDGPGRAAFFGAQDIVIGATGNAGITADDIANTNDGCVLGSASSKLVELDVGALSDLSRGADGAPRMTVIDDQGHPPSVEYALKDGTTRRLLARGYPINFDGAQENIPFEHIQLTRALMVLGLMQATGSKVAGVKRLDPKLQLEMLEHFQSLAVLQTTEQKAVLDEAIAGLRGAVAAPGSNYRRRG